MSVFDNPSFYISIFSSICFLASEILPFLPTDGNGIFHTIIKILSKYNKQPTIQKEKERIDDIDKKINDILNKLDNIDNTNP
jgi:hypothetical protein